MLVACRLAGLSALEAYYAGQSAHAIRAGGPGARNSATSGVRPTRSIRRLPGLI
jgi:hypothetical protein